MDDVWGVETELIHIAIEVILEELEDDLRKTLILKL